MEDIVTLYSDGSFRKPNKGAYALCLTWNEQSLIIFEDILNTTINRMELLGLITGLETLTRPCVVNFFSDSQYVVNTIAQGWIYKWAARGWKTGSRSPVKNQDLMERLLAQLAIHTVNAVWVKGHSGVPQNELCDELAQHLTRY